MNNSYARVRTYNIRTKCSEKIKYQIKTQRWNYSRSGPGGKSFAMVEIITERVIKYLNFSLHFEPRERTNTRTFDTKEQNMSNRIEKRTHGYIRD